MAERCLHLWAIRRAGRVEGGEVSAPNPPENTAGSVLEELMAELSDTYEVFISHGYLWIEIDGVRWRVSVDRAPDLT